MIWSWDLLLIPVLLAVFLTIHELGHIVAARLLNLYLQKVGFSMSPFPHVFVEVTWPRKKKQRTIFLLSGFLTIVALLTLVMSLGLAFKPVLIAFGIQLIIETNPVYSDFVILNITDKVSAEIARTRQPYKTVYQKVYSDYLYSPSWYIHFVLWVAFIILVVNTIKIYLP